jgi:hypothetical protein
LPSRGEEAGRGEESERTRASQPEPPATVAAQAPSRGTIEEAELDSKLATKRSPRAGAKKAAERTPQLAIETPATVPQGDRSAPTSRGKSGEARIFVPSRPPDDPGPEEAQEGVAVSYQSPLER